MLWQDSVAAKGTSLFRNICKQLIIKNIYFSCVHWGGLQTCKIRIAATMLVWTTELDSGSNGGAESFHWTWLQPSDWGGKGASQNRMRRQKPPAEKHDVVEKSLLGLKAHRQPWQGALLLMSPCGCGFQWGIGPQQSRQFPVIWGEHITQIWGPRDGVHLPGKGSQGWAPLSAWGCGDAAPTTWVRQSPNTSISHRQLYFATLHSYLSNAASPCTFSTLTSSYSVASSKDACETLLCPHCLSSDY